MYIAQNKRHENIAEYLLYLWQLEDLLRALGFREESVYSQLVVPHGLPQEKEQELLAWYMDMAELLKKEGKETSGHLEHSLHLIAELHYFHTQLMELPVGARYRELYARLEPQLPELRKVAGNDEMSDTELMFRALYAVMLYRLKGDGTGEKSAAEVIETISPLVAELASAYHKVENGQLDLFGDENENY